MNSFLRLRNINKSYGGVAALEDVSLDIDEGEVLAVVGPNGSGKTTLLKIMAAMETPTSGEYYFKDMKVDEDNARIVRARSTMVFQRPIMLHTTVYGNIEYGLKLRGLSRSETGEKVKEALRLVGLQGYERRSANNLSGGERQRVSIARALALDTELLLLDEPTANLDPKSISIIEEVISQTSKDKGTTVIIASHNLFHVEAIARRAALLLNGRMMKLGTPSEVIGFASMELAEFARLENVFSGRAEPLEYGGSIIDIGNNIWIETASKASGKALAYIRPSEIIVSRTPIISSARNALSGKVTGISDLGSKIKLKVDVGREFTVQITKRSFIEMGINLGSQIHITFKASSVRLI
ncbi:MAG: ABC transporter ATP-binding protein [Candidatus Bathyarchaeia archaeon]